MNNKSSTIKKPTTATKSAGKTAGLTTPPIAPHSTQFRGIAIIFVAVIIGGYFALAILFNLPPFRRQAGEHMTTMPAISNNLYSETYSDNDFHFQLGLSSIWNGYVAQKQKDGNTTLIALSVLTSDTKEYPSGLAAPLTIHVIPIADWERGKVEDRQLNYLGKNDQYAFAYSTWQKVPIDLITADFEINTIIKSFTIIN